MWQYKVTLLWALLFSLLCTQFNLIIAKYILPLLFLLLLKFNHDIIISTFQEYSHQNVAKMYILASIYVSVHI
jgi:hypothetical protein